SGSRRKKRLLSDLKNSPTAIFGIVVILLVSLAAVLAPVLTTYNPVSTDLTARLRPPVPLEGSTFAHMLGTDALGRDILTRLLYGARVSLLVGIVSVLISGAIGVSLGLMTGYFGGWFDDIVMRLADIQLAFPFILLMMAVLAVIGPGLRNLILVLGVTGWVTYARLARGQVLSLREKEFVEAARSIGAGNLRIIFKHILPNTLGPIIVIASFAVASTIISEATLSFLGLGVKPTTPTWGMMLSEGREYVRQAWWLTTLPGLAIAITVLGINLLGVISRTEHLVVVDTMRNHGKPGDLYRLQGDAIPDRIRAKNSLHQVDFLEALTLCQALDKVPETVIIGVEPEDIQTLSLVLTPPVQAQVEPVIQMVLRELERLGASYRRKEASDHVPRDSVENNPD
ncbi:MAG: hydrogenase maturation protease, partial [Chloroflexota bacterium]